MKYRYCANYARMINVRLFFLYAIVELQSQILSRSCILSFINLPEKKDNTQ